MTDHTFSPLVSVVIPTYNRRAVLEEAINSVLAQTYPNWELIIADDGSTDDTEEWMRKECIKDNRINYLKLKNQGAAVARNSGASRGKGKYLTFLDSDDLAYDTWLEKMVSKIEEADADLVSCGTLRREKGRAPFPKLPTRPGGIYFDFKLKLTNAGAFLLKRAVFDEIGGYDPLLRSGQHTEMGLRLASLLHQRGGLAVTVDEPLVEIIDRGGGSIRKSDEAVYQGSTYFIKKHEHYLKSIAPDQLFDYLNVAGVRGMRAGHTKEARGYLRNAIRLKPMAVKTWLRLASSYFK